MYNYFTFFMFDMVVMYIQYVQGLCQSDDVALFITITFQYSVRTSQETYCFTVIKTSRSMLRREMIDVYCGDYIKQYSKLY
jgi:hypothetical protein